MEQKLSLSTHILDTTQGKPSSNVQVKLFKLVEGTLTESSFNGRTDKDGRVKEFSKVNSETSGVYKLRFEIAEYFERIGVETLYPFIEVEWLFSGLKLVLKSFFCRFLLKYHPKLTITFHFF